MKKILPVALLVLALAVFSPTITRAVVSFFIADNGNVGIKNSSPEHALDVSGAMYSRLVTATTSNINWNSGNVQTMTLSSNPTLTFSNAQAGGIYTLIVNQDSTGGRNISWPNSIRWAGGLGPILTSTASGTDLISFVYDGNKYLGRYDLDIKQSSLVNSLISYWKLDESSGSANDSVGSNNLTNNNSVTYTSGKINNAGSFSSASSQYLSISQGSQSGLDFSGSFSISAWYKPNSSSGWQGIVSKRNNSGNNLGYFLSYGDVASKFSAKIESTSSGIEVLSGTTYSTGNWHHVVLTVSSGGVATLYVDGSQAGQTSGATFNYQNSSTPFMIGAGQANPTGYADGLIDEVGTWSRELTSGEVSTLYNSGNGRQYPF